MFAWRHFFTFWLLLFLLDASFSEQVFFHCKGKQQFWGRKTESRTSHGKIRKVESWQVKRLHCQFRKVKKSKSQKVEGSHFQFRKVEKLKSGKASYWISKSRKVKNSKSWKVEMLHIEFRKVEKSLLSFSEASNKSNHMCFSLGKPGSYVPSFIFGSIE